MAPHLAWGQTATGTFAGRAFSFQLPRHYALVREAALRPDVHTFRYAATPRPDGSQALIQVTLIDMTAMPDTERPTLDAFASQMVAEQSREDGWTERDSDVRIDDVPARRVEWSLPIGRSPARPRDVKPRRLLGTMILGFKDNIAFALHVQDAQPYADSTVATGDRALRTFRLIRRP